MDLDTFLDRTGAWLAPDSDANIEISSRIRIARNLKGFAFPWKANDAERLVVWEKVEPVLNELSEVKAGIICQTSTLSELASQLLFERHLISRELMRRREASGVAVYADESAAVMVNEEDHIRLQTMGAGLCLSELWNKATQLDDRLEQELEYAYSATWGYLTSCPTNVGTGMRASVMLHLPGLALVREIPPIIKGLRKIGLTVRGLWGEGSDAAGNMFQISNQVTMGDQETAIIHNLEEIVRELVQHEKNARLRLLEDQNVLLRDHVGRAFGLLTHAHLLTSSEALNLLSALRLGYELDMIDQIDRCTINELLMLTQPAHLQKMAGHYMEAIERDQTRANLIRTKLREPEYLKEINDE